MHWRFKKVHGLSSEGDWVNGYYNGGLFGVNCHL